jgi:hypothetical protein
MGPTWIVVIVRHDETDVEEYDDENEARSAFETAKSEGRVYLAVVRAEAK